MIKLKPLTIEDRELIERYYDINRFPNSECNFTNMLMWQKGYNIHYAIVEGFLCLFASNPSTGFFCHFPIGLGDVKPALDKLIFYFKEQGKPFNMRPLTKCMKDKIEQGYPERFIYTEHREYFDYIYSVNELIELKGKKLHPKRNHLNNFITDYDFTYGMINESNVQACRDAVVNWITERPGADMDEVVAVNTVFNNYFKLNVKGAYLQVEDKIVAVTVGEDHHGYVLVHIEKADTNYRGVYAAVNQMFLQNEWQGYELVNREEDMGIEGLRKAKLSYQPRHLVEKYSAGLPNNVGE